MPEDPATDAQNDLPSDAPQETALTPETVEQDAARALGAPEGVPPLEVLEDDETVPPRPEEQEADRQRSAPDPH